MLHGECASTDFTGCPQTGSRDRDNRNPQSTQPTADTDFVVGGAGWAATHPLVLVDINLRGIMLMDA